MIVYFDTSAFLPVIVAEAGSPTAVRLWREARRRVSSRLIVVEAAAAVAMGMRVGRLTAEEHDVVQEDAWRFATNMTLVDAFGDIVGKAAELAITHSLRGYDAVHLATATIIQSSDVVFASGDRRLLDAARREGFATADTAVAGA